MAAESDKVNNWQEMVVEAARGLGFALVGITEARAAEYGDYFRGWLAEGKHGEMGYLARNVEVRLDPGKLLEGARSVIVVADVYPTEMSGGCGDTSEGEDEGIGQVSRYAWGDDYHKTIKGRLFELADGLKERYPEAGFKVTVDTAPIFEREQAARAGLGWVGKHTLLINQERGSYLLLGLIVTTLESRVRCADQINAQNFDDTSAPSHCGRCTRCIDACPTGCIEEYQVDASRCISYLTLEHRSVIEVGLHEQMGSWIAGCDVCQQVCPFNSRSTGATGGLSASAEDVTYHPAYRPRPPAPGIELLAILNWTEEDRRAAFRKSALKRMKLDMVYRNALIAAGNYLKAHEDETLLERIRELKEDEEMGEVVRETAGQVLGRLG